MPSVPGTGLDHVRHAMADDVSRALRTDRASRALERATTLELTLHAQRLAAYRAIRHAAAIARAWERIGRRTKLAEHSDRALAVRTTIRAAMRAGGVYVRDTA